MAESPSRHTKMISPRAYCILEILTTTSTPAPSPRYDPSGICSKSLLTQGLASFAPAPSLPDDTGNTATGGGMGGGKGKLCGNGARPVCSDGTPSSGSTLNGCISGKAPTCADGSAVGSGDTAAGGGVGVGFFFLGLVLAALAGAGVTFFLLPRCMRKKGSAATIITDRKLDIGL